MSKTEIGTIAGLLVAVASGALWLGHLTGKIEGLNPKAIREAQSAAIIAIRGEVEKWGSFVDPKHEAGWVLKVKDDRKVHEKQLISVDEGICFITGIQGKFEGNAEHVWIEPVLGHWFLRGTSRQPWVEVSARCWRFPGNSAATDDDA